MAANKIDGILVSAISKIDGLIISAINAIDGIIISTLNAIMTAYIIRVEADSGTIENIDCANTALDNFVGTPSLFLFPSGFKAGTLYAEIPDTPNDFTSTRASNATRTNEAGDRELMANNVPRVDFEGGGCGKLLTEAQATNIYLNSATLSTQNVTTSAADYTVSFYGTGTITFTGSFVGSLVGTGVNDRVELTFTATSGTLTSTISGSVTEGQCELGDMSSYIPTTGSSATRLKDEIYEGGSVDDINSLAGTFYFEGKMHTADISSDALLSVSDGSINNSITIQFRASDGQLKLLVRSGGTIYVNTGVNSLVFDSLMKIAVVWESNHFALWFNGVSVLSDNSGTPPVTNTMDRVNFSSTTSGFQCFLGETYESILYKTVLTNQELEDLTTL